MVIIDLDRIKEWVIDKSADAILNEALELADKIVSLFNGKTKVILTPDIKNSRQLIVWALAIRLAKNNIGDGKRINVKVVGKRIILRLVKSRKKEKEDALRAYRGLRKIAKIWYNIRGDVGDLIETLIETAPRYVLKRMLLIFESLDMLINLLSKIPNECKKRKKKVRVVSQ